MLIFKGGRNFVVYLKQKETTKSVTFLLAIIMPLNERGKRTDYTKLIKYLKYNI